MFLTVWEFWARAGQEEAFERAYGPDGWWSKLFERGDGYIGTELLGDVDQRSRYVTIDRWASRAAYEAFRRRWAEEYRDLDRHLEALTERETALGRFVPPKPRLRAWPRRLGGTLEAFPTASGITVAPLARSLGLGDR